MQAVEPKPIAFEGDEPVTNGEPRSETVTAQVTFATRAPGPLQDLTERRPGLAIDAYPLGGMLLLRFLGDAEGIEDAPELRESDREVLYQNRSGKEVTFLLSGGKPEEESIASLAADNAHILPPIRWQRGEALITLLLEDGADPRTVLDRFPEARLVSKRRPVGRQGPSGPSRRRCSSRSSRRNRPARCSPPSTRATTNSPGTSRRRT